MSLINKMLQDLDARSGAGAQVIPPHIKPVAHAPRRPNRRVMAAAVAAALAGVAAAWFGMGQYRSVQPGPAPIATAPAAAKPAAAPLKPGQGMTSTIKPLPDGEPVPAVAAAAPDAESSAPAAASAVASEPASAAGPVPVPVPAPAAPREPAPAAVHGPAPARVREQGAASVADFAPDPVVKPRGVAAPAQAMRREPAVPARRAALETPAAVAAPAAQAAQAAKSVAPLEPDSAEARAIRRALALELEARAARKAAAPREARSASAGRQENTAQRAEGAYRRALASLQEGRMAETVAALEQTLRIDPGHEAARQTLVGLLIEAKRPDDAMRQLQLALTQDPRQPALAMLLARLQIERGGSGIDTLMRTLPYAGADPDYHAFLAGALQREQRHREAAAEYMAALRAVPGNGVWWMGLGISLQAERRNAEALSAFQKAQASGRLSLELQGFVERQMLQLGR